MENTQQKDPRIDGAEDILSSQSARNVPLSTLGSRSICWLDSVGHLCSSLSSPLQRHIHDAPVVPKQTAPTTAAAPIQPTSAPTRPTCNLSDSTASRMWPRLAARNAGLVQQSGSDSEQSTHGLELSEPTGVGWSAADWASTSLQLGGPVGMDTIWHSARSRSASPTTLTSRRSLQSLQQLWTPYPRGGGVPVEDRLRWSSSVYGLLRSVSLPDGWEHAEGAHAVPEGLSHLGAHG